MTLFLSALFALGVAVGGFILGRITIRKDGLFIIDDSDDETTRWILDVKTDPNAISNKKQLHLVIKKMDEGGRVKITPS